MKSSTHPTAPKAPAFNPIPRNSTPAPPRRPPGGAHGLLLQTRRPATLRRMVAFHPQAVQGTKSVEIIEALSLVCSQKLVPSLDGRRIALREFLILTDDIRDELMGCHASEIAIKSKRILLAHGQTFYSSARHALELGLISKATAGLESHS